MCGQVGYAIDKLLLTVDWGSSKSIAAFVKVCPFILSFFLCMACGFRRLRSLVL